MEANVTITKGYHKFEFFVKQNTKSYNHKYTVVIRQTTKMDEFGLDDFITTYTCACPNSQTEDSAIHYAGKKYLKDWDTRARLGKDNPIC